MKTPSLCSKLKLQESIARAQWRRGSLRPLKYTFSATAVLTTALRSYLFDERAARSRIIPLLGS